MAHRGKYPTPPGPRKGWRSRFTGPKRKETGVGMSEKSPERADPRFTGKRRGKYPADKGGTPKPERTKPRKTGDAMDNTFRSNVVPPIVTREGGGSGKPAGSTGNPFKVTNKGSKKIANTTKNPKAP